LLSAVGGANEPVAEQGMNPLFALGGGGVSVPAPNTGDPLADSKSLNETLAALLAQPNAPSFEVWSRVRATYARVSEAADRTAAALIEARAQLASAKREEGRASAVSDGGGVPRAVSSRMTAAQRLAAFAPTQARGGVARGGASSSNRDAE